MRLDGIMRPEERIAASLIQQVRTGSRMVHAASEESGQCDFTLHIGDYLFPVEVTSVTSDGRRRQYARIGGRAGEGEFVKRALAKRGWYVTLSVRSDPRDVRERIDAHVAAIENEDRRSFDVREDPDRSDAVRAIWTDLWVTDGTETAEVPDGYIALGYPPDSATLGSDQLNEAIQLQAEKPDNLRKLDVTASERHLFVYVDWHGYPAHSVMKNGLLPSEFPRVSEIITHVWAAAPVGLEDDHVLWTADRKTGWSALGVFRP